MKKHIVLLLLIFSLASQVFAISFTYRDVQQGYDSYVLLNQFQQNGSTNTGGSDISEIGIIFWGPGDAPHLYYGHVGLVVEKSDGTARLYDYGVFNPSEKGFVNEVIHGRMFYELASSPFNLDYMFEAGKYTKRSLHYYHLNGLSKEQKEFIASFLEFNYSDNRHKYLYNFFSDNCSTRVRDILDKAYNDTLSKLGERYYGTRRMSIEEQTEPHVAVETIYGIAEGYLQDKPITYYEAMFLPSYLEMALGELEVAELNEDGDIEIVKAITPVKISEWENAWPYETSFNTHNSNWMPLILIAVVLAILNVGRLVASYFVKNKIAIRVINKVFAFINAFVLLFIFILSLAMAFLQLYTLIDCGWKNENSIFINPLIIVSVFFAFKALFSIKSEKENKAIESLSYSALVFLALTVLALILKIVLPHQANILHITSFGLYYLSLSLQSTSLFNKIKRSKK